MPTRSKPRPIVLAIFSDLHAGSTLAPCGVEPIPYDDGGEYHPSTVQLWLWQQWLAFWREVETTRKAHRATLGILSNGDLVDGPGHHKTHQSIGPNSAEQQAEAAIRCLAVPKALAPDWFVMVKGTSSHTGPGSDFESGMAKHVGAERDPSTGAASWYHWRAELHNTRIHATHHGRSGGRPWTMASAAGILASEILMEHVQADVPHPHLAIRSHKHTPFDSGDMHPVRVLGTPAWQLMTEFGHKVVPEKAVNPIVGGYIIVLESDTAPLVLKRFYRPAAPPVWRPAA